SSLGENVGMGQNVDQIHQAFMNSEHHRENILDAGFNQVGIGVIVVDGGMFVTEDFLYAKGGPVTARPTPVAHPVVKKPARAPAPSSRVAAAPKKVTPSSTSPPATAAPSSPAPPTTESTGVVTALDPVASAHAAAAATVKPRAAGASGAAALAAALGVLLLLSAAGGHVVVRRRNQS